MIFHKQKAIHFHVGKAAGTSVEMLMMGTHGYHVNPNPMRKDIMFGWDWRRDIWLQHAVPNIYRKEMNPKDWDEYFKFAIVRNPYKRMLSVYWYNNELRKKYGSFRGFLKKLPDVIDDDVNVFGSHLTRQVDHVSIDGVNICDSVIRMEDLPNAFDPLLERFKIDKPLPHNNPGGRKKKYDIDLIKSYSRGVDQIVAELYAEDFERFGYSTDLNDA